MVTARHNSIKETQSTAQLNTEVDDYADNDFEVDELVSKKEKRMILPTLIKTDCGEVIISKDQIESLADEAERKHRVLVSHHKRPN